MNGIHDMGGMQGMGAIQRETNEPVFHEVWEGRMYAINRAIGALNKWNLDAGRHAIESLPPLEFLRMSYYERWLVRNTNLLVKHGVLTQEEIESGKPAPGIPKATPPLAAANAAATAGRRANYMRASTGARPRFKVGERIRSRKMNPVGHTRLPRYAKGREGVIHRHHGIFVFPDANAHFQEEQPQHLYSVRFAARELWGNAASPRDSVYLDLWESYLEHS